MMDCGMKTLIFLSLCALVGANSFQKIDRNLEILVSVPSSHLGDVQIGKAILQFTSGHPLLYLVEVEKNTTRCVNSTDPQCDSLIKEPIVDVSVNSRANNGKSFTYSDTINGSTQLVIQVDTEVNVMRQMLNSTNDQLLVALDVQYNRAITSMSSLSSSRKPTTFSLNANFLTTTNILENNGQGNGQPSLRPAPLISFLLALLPFFLLK